MRRRTTSIAAGALAFGFLTAPAGAVTRPDYAGLNECAPDVTTTYLDPTSAAVTFTVPDDCSPQRWVVIVEDYHRNSGAAYPADGRTRLAEEHITARPGVPVEWSWSTPSALCGGQIDLVLEGQSEIYAAAVFEMDGCQDVVGPTATPPPAPDNTTPPEGRPSVAGVVDSGGGVGDDTVVLATTTASPAPLVQIATQPRVGTLPATLPATGPAQVAQFAFIAAVAIGLGALMLIGGFVVEWLDRRARVRRIVREQVRR